MSEEKKFRWVGTRPVRPDGIDKVTGRANYGADFALPLLAPAALALADEEDAVRLGALRVVVDSYCQRMRRRRRRKVEPSC